ncbi:hypothetical protein [Mycobacterium dioxanotrophicus]|uniref:hypothetical protein n=1 Tax=Mycobacterium dioxanotrophicus TaxID=482462 RepID=UPI001E589460|nr:hypothetical protein [Mycobacterium dioxanotrophicus]
MAVSDGAIHSHTAAVRLTPAELARELLDHLGPTVVAALSQVRNRKQPYKWAIDDGPRPRIESLQRLQVAHRAWWTIAESEGDEVARAWFIGANPRLDEVPPYMAIREGRFSEVLAAADEFVVAG